MRARDHAYMARALQLAARGLYSTDPNPRVGCVVVNNDVIVGEGWHAVAGGPHAEVNALQQAGEHAAGATAYVTLEPCCHFGRTPPCTRALIDAGVARVVVAMEDPSPQMAGQGLAELRRAGIEIAEGIAAQEAQALNIGFVTRIRRGRPYVRLKAAMSTDGRSAMANGESQWITSREARLDGQRLRARSSAVLTGIGTVLADDPRLTVRVSTTELGLDDQDVPLQQPLRIIADSGLRIPVTARLLAQAGTTLIATCADDPRKHDTLQSDYTEVLYLPPCHGRVDLDVLMHELAQRGVNELLVEAGPVLNGALLQAGLIDELVCYIAPRLLGDEGRGIFHLPGLEYLDQAVRLTFTDARSVGPDLRLTARLHTEGDRAAEDLR